MVMGSSLGAYLSNRSSMLEPDALLALPGGSERRAANEEKHGAFTAESVLSCCERDSAENMPLGEMVSRRFREERAGRAGQKSGRVRQEASAVRRALRRGKTVSSSSSRPAAVPRRDIFEGLHFRGRLVGPRFPTGDELHGLSDCKDRHPYFRDRRRSRIRAQQSPAQVAERLLIR